MEIRVLYSTDTLGPLQPTQDNLPKTSLSSREKEAKEMVKSCLQFCGRGRATEEIRSEEGSGRERHSSNGPREAGGTKL